MSIKKTDERFRGLQERFGAGIYKLRGRLDLLYYLTEEGEKDGVNLIVYLSSVMILMDTAYDPAFLNNVRLTGLTDEEFYHSNRTLRMAKNLRKVFPERPELIDVIEHMKDHGGLGYFCNYEDEEHKHGHE